MMTQAKAARESYSEISRLDQDEQDRLVMENLPLVYYMARRLHNRLPEHIPFEDLVNAGIVGLLGAIRNYDPSRQVKLMTYAKQRIEGAMVDSLRDLDWSPRDLRRRGREVERALQQLGTQLGRAPLESEVAAEMGMDLHALQGLLCELRGLDLGSLEAIAEENQLEEPLAKYIPVSHDDAYYLCLQSELRDCLARAVGELPERERQILALYYVEELTMKETGKVLGVGEGRISQLHSAALLRLRARLQELLSSSGRSAPEEKMDSSHGRGIGKN